MHFAAFLVGMVPSLLAQVFLSLGVGLLTITGVSLVFDQLEALLVDQLGGITGIGAALLGMAGVGTATGMIIGAMTARVTLAALINTTRIVAK